VQNRGITIRQLRGVWANIDRRCVQEEWVDFEGNLLSPKDVTLYDVNKYVIMPFTVTSQESFVSSLPSTAGAQPPRWFVSHWWGEAVFDFISCIEQHARDFGQNRYDETDKRGGGMNMDTPIWICAYANDQWHLSGDITDDPKESGFSKAMVVAKNRTITILDEKGVVYSRIWCVYELFSTIVNTDEENDGLWVVYTAHQHTYKDPSSYKEQKRDALGIIPGGATNDGGPNRTAARERSFPFHLITKSLDIQVEVAEASLKEDKNHILNAIVGRCGIALNETPLNNHEMYDELNDAVKASFASSPANLQAASKKSDDVWMKFLHALSKGKKKIEEMAFYFDEDGWGGLTSEHATQLIAHLPLTIGQLTINDAKFGKGFIDAVSDHIGRSSGLHFLGLMNTLAGEEDVGRESALRLTEAISKSTTIQNKQSYCTGKSQFMNISGFMNKPVFLKKSDSLSSLRNFDDEYVNERCPSETGSVSSNDQDFVGDSACSYDSFSSEDIKCMTDMWEEERERRRNKLGKGDEEDSTLS